MMSKGKMGQKNSTHLYHAFLYLVLTIGAIVSMIPFFWMLSTSLKPNSGIFRFPPDWIPNPVDWSSYAHIFTKTTIVRAMGNSLKIAFLNTIGALFTCSLAAYAFAQLEFRGKKGLFLGLISTMMIPTQVTLIPMFILFKYFGWIDTHLPLIVPSLLSNAYGVFLLRQFYMTVPKSLMEAAKIDGAPQPLIYFKIMLPLGLPALATFGLIAFLGNWNNFLTPLIYISSKTKYTLPLLVSTFKDQYSVQWNRMMAGAFISMVPIAIVYIFAQRYFVDGIVMTGMKA